MNKYLDQDKYVSTIFHYYYLISNGVGRRMALLAIVYDRRKVPGISSKYKVPIFNFFFRKHNKKYK